MYLRTRAFNDLDRMFARFVGHAADAVPARTHSDDDGSATLTPAVESFRRDDQLVLRAEMPGVEQSSVNVSVENGRLTISGEKREERSADESLLYRETRYGRFQRTFTLPESFDTNEITAHMTDGVLEVRIAVPKKLSPRRIPIESGSVESSSKAA